MEQEVINPEHKPKTSRQAFSPFGCFLAASGVTLMTFCLLGAAAAAAVWAIAKLMGFPDILLYGFFALAAIPVLWATVWIGGRAWHVERRLAQGLDVDVPVFVLSHYLRKSR